MQKHQEKKQVTKFVQAARKLECDESEEAFDKKLRQIAKQKPPEKPKKKRRG